MTIQDQQDFRARHPIQNPDPKLAVQHRQRTGPPFTGQWQQQIGAAKVQWGKLTSDELQQSRGEVQKLSGLLQERYSVCGEVAEKQVTDFFASRKN